MTLDHQNLTEAFMADAFEKYLLAPTRELEYPDFPIIEREVKCQQGIADFIVSPEPNDPDNKNSFAPKYSGQSSESYFRILSLFGKISTLTLQDLTKITGYERPTILRTINSLKAQEIIVQNKDSTLSLSRDWSSPAVEFWAFELKLSNWKRALFQALQYKAYASISITVFPKEKEKLLIKHLNNFKSTGIGIVLFDPKDNSFQELLPPQKTAPSSWAHYLYVFYQMQFRKTSFTDSYSNSQ